MDSSPRVIPNTPGRGGFTDVLSEVHLLCAVWFVCSTVHYLILGLLKLFWPELSRTNTLGQCKSKDCSETNLA